MSNDPIQPVGRGSGLNPINRFTNIELQLEPEYLDSDPDAVTALKRPRTRYYEDSARSIVSENSSPDVPFRYSLNPYRGCAHGCSYCYARPTHEYLGLNAGLDFETTILVKKNAATLFRDFLKRKQWQPELITFSGVTDCYQPAEQQFQLTRQCLEVALQHKQPVSIITKNALIIRDLDLLTSMAQQNLVHVFLSVTTLDKTLSRTMEPRTSSPDARLHAVRQLTHANVPVGVMIAPVIPGLTDSEIPALLAAGQEAGAIMAGYILLRLPLTVEPVFLDWLERTQSTRKDKIQGRIRETRHGALNSSTWGERMRGTGEIADQIGNLFRLFQRKYKLEGKLPPLDFGHFERVTPAPKQLKLF